MKNIIQPLKGTRDFYPQDMAIRTWLYNNLRQVSELFGYQEWEAPFLESLELYAAKSGEELVKEQSFVFPDRGGDLITLRPELTPSLARMIAQRQRQLVYPLRWWSYGPFWRYERPQKGRSREFFQWNVDLIGVESPQADAEIVAVIVAFFQKVGLSPQQVNILVSNRRLLDSELATLDIPAESRPDVSRWIDRRDKMTPENWQAYALDIGLSEIQFDGVRSILSNQNLWRKSEDLVEFFTAIDAMGIQDFVRFDPNIVRGLDYYTGTVFEAQGVSGNIRRAILGGGRYDRLMEDVGGDPLPAVGFAMGDVVIGLILKEFDLIPLETDISPAPVLVTVFDQQLMPASLGLAAEFRRGGLKANCYPEVAKLPKQLKYADRMGIPVAVILGPAEIDNGQVTVKDLRNGSQTTITRQDAIQAIQAMLDYNG